LGSNPYRKGSPGTKPKKVFQLYNQQVEIYGRNQFFIQKLDPIPINHDILADPRKRFKGCKTE